jgi:hypothetical protein
MAAPRHHHHQQQQQKQAQQRRRSCLPLPSMAMKARVQRQVGFVSVGVWGAGLCRGQGGWFCSGELGLSQVDVSGCGREAVSIGLLANISMVPDYHHWRRVA